SRLAPTMRCATRLIRSASDTLEPPYFCTTSAMLSILRKRRACLTARRECTNSRDHWRGDWGGAGAVGGVHVEQQTQARRRVDRGRGATHETRRTGGGGDLHRDLLVPPGHPRLDRNSRGLAWPAEPARRRHPGRRHGVVHPDRGRHLLVLVEET